MARPSSSKVKVKLDQLSSRAGYTVELLPSSQPIEVADRKLQIGRARPRSGDAARSARRVRFLRRGASPRRFARYRRDARAPSRRARQSGRRGAACGARDRDARRSLRLEGRSVGPRASGGFELTRGEVTVRGLHAPLSEIDVAVAIENGELTIRRGSAKLGSGTLTLSAARRSGVRRGSRALEARRAGPRAADGRGIRAVADADLVTSFDPGSPEKLPRITGDVHLKSFEYKRAVTMTADIGSLAQRGRRTAVESYDPRRRHGFVRRHAACRSRAQAAEQLDRSRAQARRRGLELLGTNGRFGMRGTVELQPAAVASCSAAASSKSSRATCASTTRRASRPSVDVTAVTEYRRYADNSEARAGGPGGQGLRAAPEPPPAPARAAPRASTPGAGTSACTLHGDADNLKIDLTSDPALAQDDIFLLLTVGLTRAELDQAQSAAVGESVALEALGTLSGADRAVTDAVPLIDEFRFGSAYSSRTGRTEPTVTIGKRLAERVRANVTTGLAESREVRSNVEWQLSNRVSVEGFVRQRERHLELVGRQPRRGRALAPRVRSVAVTADKRRSRASDPGSLPVSPGARRAW